MTVYTCTFENCNKTFHRPSKLKNHYNLHTGTKPFACTVSGCDKSYTSSSHLQRHIKCSHSIQSNSNTVFACSYNSCGATFQTLWGLQRHENNHSTPFYCQKCNRYFRSTLSLNKHIKRHEIVANRKCQFCGEDFSGKQKRDLLRHEKIHSLFKCEFCDKMFSKLWEYQRHLINHESRFECAHCGATMKKKNSLRAHIRTLHLGFMEPYVCEEIGCPKIYHYKRNCTKHKLQHDVKFRFKCPIANCCQEFIYKKTYQHHLQLHQKNEVKCKKESKSIDTAEILVKALCS